ncbi:hypothetical protein QUF70_20050 [Desulfobacterales bacterium HSG17]|nr:hypothetical protein [Desulfobacterales bacterium HSG17]
MLIGSDNEYIKLKELERIPATTSGAGDINLEVHIVLQDFSGSYSGIWLETPAIDKFLRDLIMLEESGNGKAVVSSMSPEEFVLEIRSTENPNYMEIEVQLHRYQYSVHGGIKYWPVYLKGGFEVPPETVIQLISCFKSYIT